MKKDSIFTPLSGRVGKLDLGPQAFFDNIRGPVGRSLQADFDYRLADFCRIHQVVYANVLASDDSIGRIDPETYKHSHDLDDIANIFKSRIRERIIATDIVNARMIAFVDQITIVGLWAIAEMYLAKIFRETKSMLDGVSRDEVASPYRWDDFVSNYLTLGIDLNALEGFHDANECRALNNSIKHNPKVDGRLATHGFFTEKLGLNLDDIELEMQRYVNGVSDMIGSLIRKANFAVLPDWTSD